MSIYSDEINLGSYEKEKLESTKKQLQRIADMIDLVIKTLEYCEDRGVFISNRPNLHDLRYPKGLAGPESDISKLESKLEKVQLTILKGMEEEQIKDMEKELSLRFTSDKSIRKKEVSPVQTRGYNG